MKKGEKRMSLRVFDPVKQDRSFAIPILGAFVAVLLAAPVEAAQLLFASEVTVPDSRLVQVDPVTGAVVSAFPIQQGIIISGMAYNPTTGVLFGSSTSYGGDSLYKIDTTTGAYTLVRSLGHYFPGLAVQPGTHALFGMTLDGDLYTIDTNTGMSTMVGGDAALSSAHGLVFSPTGVLYASDTAGSGTSKLFRVDPSDGSASFIGVIPRDYVVSLAFDGTGSLYGCDNGAGSLVKIDPNTGSASTVGAFGNNNGHLAIEFVPEPQALLMLTLIGPLLARCRRAVA